MSADDLVDVIYRHDGEVAQITLNRARYANALNASLVEALLTAVQGCLDRRVELLVLRGSGAVFCGGFDLQGLESETDASLAYRFLRLETLLQAIHYAPCQTLVYAQGTVSGSGADLMAACRKRYAAQGASFRFPGIRFGILLGTNRLLGLVGEKAYGVLLRQQKINGDQAVAMGLVHELANDDDVDALVESEYEALTRIPKTTRRQLFTESTLQHAIDMGVLAKTLAEPGLKDRMQLYWEQIRSAKRNRAIKTR